MVLYNCKWLFWAGGFTLFPPLIFIKSKKDEDPCLVEHEEVHVDQCLELSPVWFGKIIWPIGWIKWWSIYIKDFIINSIKHKSLRKGYENIPYEVEAYDRQRECYLDFRKRTTY